MILTYKSCSRSQQSGMQEQIFFLKSLSISDHFTCHIVLCGCTDYGYPIFHKSKKFEILGQCRRQNMLLPYLNTREWELIFGRAVKGISSPSVRSLCIAMDGDLETVLVAFNALPISMLSIHTMSLHQKLKQSRLQTF